MGGGRGAGRGRGRGRGGGGEGGGLQAATNGGQAATGRLRALRCVLHAVSSCGTPPRIAATSTTVQRRAAARSSGSAQQSTHSVPSHSLSLEVRAYVSRASSGKRRATSFRNPTDTRLTIHLDDKVWRAVAVLTKGSVDLGYHTRAATLGTHWVPTHTPTQGNTTTLKQTAPRRTRARYDANLGNGVGDPSTEAGAAS